MSLRLIASGLAVLTFGLLVLGGVVHSTGSSLACPDWPTCYGSFLPAMRGGIRFEHSHRIVAMVTATGTVWLAWLLRRRRSAQHTLARVGYLAVALVLLQASLGGATVLLRLPPAVSEAHLLVGTTFFATTLWLAWTLRESQQSPAAANALRQAVRVSVALAFVQILLGGLVRHSGSSLVCLTFPGCSNAAWLQWDQPRTIVHMVHRATAVLLGGGLVVMLALATREGGRALRISLGLVGLLVAQVALGVASVTSMLAVSMVVPHLAVGLLLFAGLWLFNLELSAPHRGTFDRKRDLPLAPQERSAVGGELRA